MPLSNLRFHENYGRCICIHWLPRDCLKKKHTRPAALLIVVVLIINSLANYISGRLAKE